MMQGLPSSGKTEFALKMAIENPSYIVVSYDSILNMLGADPDETKHLHALTKTLLLSNVVNALNYGFNVVVDVMGLSYSWIESLTHLAKMYNANFEIHSLMHVPIDDCIYRDSHKPVPIGSENIIRLSAMYREFHK